MWAPGGAPYAGATAVNIERRQRLWWAGAALGVILVLYPRLSAEEASDIMVPHTDRIAGAPGVPT